MKILMILIAVLSSAVHAGTKFDCRNGVDPHGGKYCYYTIPMYCGMEDCEEAVKCAVKNYEHSIARNIVSVAVTSQIADEVIEDRNYSVYSIRTMESCSGMRCQKTGTVSTEFRPEQNICVPVAYIKK